MNKNWHSEKKYICLRVRNKRQREDTEMRLGWWEMWDRERRNRKCERISERQEIEQRNRNWAIWNSIYRENIKKS